MTDNRKGGKAGGSILRPFLFVAGLAVVSGILCYVVEGEAAFRDALAAEAELLMDVIPRIAAGMFLVGFLTVLIPPEPIGRLLGEGSGLMGLLIATAAGAATPGGPWVVFPLVVMFSRSGADLGACIAYVTAWSLISLQRLLVWEFAFLGTEVAVIRYVSCLPLPILAGMFARRFLTLMALPSRTRR